MSTKKKLSKKAVISIIVTVVIAVLAVATIILNAFIPVRYLSAYTVGKNRNVSGELRITYVDAGFGDCTLLELPDGKVALIDGGDGGYHNTLKLLKTLNSCGVNQIDYLVCTSVKKEHCGGLAEIVKLKTVKTVYLPYCYNERITDEYYAFKQAIKENKVVEQIACVGNGFYGDDYFFAFLSPSNYSNPLSEYTAMNSNPNKANIDNVSAVCWLECFGKKFVFSSDARSDALERVIADYDLYKELNAEYCPFNGWSVDLDECDVATVEGHGGEDNACSKWWSLLKPRYAIVSVGLNYGGYPSALSLSNPTGVDARVYLTSESGNVQIKVNEKSLDLTVEKN